MSVGDTQRSAGDVEWREIIVRLRPEAERVGVAVYSRRNRGTALVWERRLGSLDVPRIRGTATDSVAGCLRAVCLALEHVADALDG